MSILYRIVFSVLDEVPPHYNHNSVLGQIDPEQQDYDEIFFFAEFLYSSKISVSEDGISGISPEDGISISESSEEEVVRIFFFSGSY